MPVMWTVLWMASRMLLGSAYSIPLAPAMISTYVFVIPVTLVVSLANLPGIDLSLACSSRSCRADCILPGLHTCHAVHLTNGEHLVVELVRCMKVESAMKCVGSSWIGYRVHWSVTEVGDCEVQLGYGCSVVPRGWRRSEFDLPSWILGSLSMIPIGQWCP